MTDDPLEPMSREEWEHAGLLLNWRRELELSIRYRVTTLLCLSGMVGVAAGEFIGQFPMSIGYGITALAALSLYYHHDKQVKIRKAELDARRK